MSADSTTLTDVVGVPLPRSAPAPASGPLDRDVPVPRGPRDPYREYLLSPEEHSAVLAAVTSGRAGSIELRPRDHSGRVPLWIFPGGAHALEVTTLLARLRGHELSTAETAWARTDVLAPLPERALLHEIDTMITSVVVSIGHASPSS